MEDLSRAFEMDLNELIALEFPGNSQYGPLIWIICLSYLSSSLASLSMMVWRGDLA